MTASRREAPPDLFVDGATRDDSYFAAHFGLFARQEIRAMARRKLIQAYRAIEDAQYQPASLDLRLGKEAYRVRASFLPGRERTVMEQLDSLHPERISLTGRGRGAREGHCLYRAVDGAPRAFAEPFGRRQSEELDRTSRYFHPPDRRSQRGVRRCAARLSRPALCRDFAAKFQRARARGFAAQSGEVPQPQFQAQRICGFRSERPGNPRASRQNAACRQRSRSAAKG